MPVAEGTHFGVKHTMSYLCHYHCKSAYRIQLKAIGGGSGVKKTCQAYFEELIAVVSTLFTECQNSTPFRRYDQFNFRGFDFYIGKRGVIFGDFFTIFAYKIFNIDVENTKIVTKMQTMDVITKKILKLKIFENFGQNWANFDKKCHFLQKCDLFKITFCVIT